MLLVIARFPAEIVHELFEWTQRSSGLQVPAPRANLVRAFAVKSGAPSVVFDAEAIFASAEGVKPLLKNSAAIDPVRDAFGHLKVIRHTAAAQPLFAKGIVDDLDEGVIELGARASIRRYIDTAKRQRVWVREARLS